TATHKIFSAGGTDAAANAAVANLDWSKFFVESPASTAVPISFVAKTVNGREVVNLVQSEVYEQREDCALITPSVQIPKSYDITVVWTKTDNTGACFGSSTLGTCLPTGRVHPQSGSPTILTAGNDWTASFRYNVNEDGDGLPENDPMSLKVASTSTLIVLGGSGLKFRSQTYNVRTMPEGNTTLVHRFSNFAGSVSITYRITKKTNY